MIHVAPDQLTALPIAGEAFAGARAHEVRNPFTGEIFARIAVGEKAQMEAAIACGVEAFAAFSAWPRYRRKALLESVSRRLIERKEEIAGTITGESAKPLRFSEIEVDRASSTFAFAAEAVGRSGDVLPLDVSPSTVGYSAIVERRAIGLVGAIAPFNFPLNLVAHKLAPAFAVGNTVVLKPPPQAPVTSLLLADVLYECGLPREALSVIHCDVEVAQLLATDDRIAMLSFTGSSGVGWHLKSIAGRKRVALELGGNAAAIVLGDADLAWTAQRCALGAFAQAGQVCIKVQRIYVDDGVWDAFVPEFVKAANALPAGDPRDKATVLGPLIDDANAARVEAWIEEAKRAGAKVLAGGTRSGRMVEATVLTDTTQAMKVESEEVFGPVVTLTRVNGLDDAIERTNRSRFGLQAGVFTHDLRAVSRAFERLDVGAVIANDYPTLRVDNYPYGGIKESGFGREGVTYAMDEMSELHTLVVKWT
ncbi:MAG: aldehyde dehydrogenase family protein [Vulcanimicrobiaceae bacterium]